MFDASLFGSAFSRRDFMKAITTVTAVMGLPAAMAPKVAEAAESDKRPPVIWLHFQECTGCSESILRSGHPDVASLILEVISLEYHETLMPGSGIQAEHALEEAIEKYSGQYILVCEGAVPLKEDGIYCKVGGVTAKDSLEHAAKNAFAVICMGTCAALGGLQAAAPNPTGAVSCASLVHDKPLINLPGCPPNPYNLPATILYFLTFGKLPELDASNRPMFAYGRTLHEHCERRPHFDAGRFAKSYGDLETHAEGYCLYELGCKGPATYANCSTLRFNDGVAWPVSIGHPCIGCTEQLVFNTTIAEKVQIVDPTSPAWFPPAKLPYQGKPAGIISAVVVGGIAGAALGYAAGKATALPDDKESGNEKH
ncbi:MAG: hydrogenase small subunit [Deferribacteraceae bacterium]|nr:hydrogenase small subunit [Deferribacteraceae bacterium]